MNSENSIFNKEKENESFKPIRACLVEEENVDESTLSTIWKIRRNGEFVDYSGNEEVYKKRNIKNAGKETYAMSECTPENKYSNEYFNSTGIIIVGEEKNSKKQISFMTHQDPEKFLEDKKELFTKDLTDLIKIIKEKCKEKSIDAIIFGGNAGFREYQESIKFLGNIITKELGFEPTVMTGPKSILSKGDEPTAGYFDTQNRRLYIRRSKQASELNESYLPSEVKKQSSKW